MQWEWSAGIVLAKTKKSPCCVEWIDHWAYNSVMCALIKAFEVMSVGAKLNFCLNTFLSGSSLPKKLFLEIGLMWVKIIQ